MMRRKKRERMEAKKLLLRCLMMMDDELEKLSGRVGSVEETHEGIIAQIEAMGDEGDDRDEAESVLWEEVRDIRKRLEELEAALDGNGAEQSRAERDMRDGMDAIFGYAPASMKGADNG